MKKNLALALGIALLLASPSLALAGDEKGAKPPEMSKEDAAMMEAAMTAAQPGEPHKKLAAQVGRWDAAVTLWMKPGAEPMASIGTSEIEMILGGRFQKQTMKGEFGGMPYEGFGLTGWDNVQEKFVSVWIDNMGTGVMLGEGHPTKDGNGAKFEATYPDPLTKKLQKHEEIFRFVGPDEFVMEMWSPDPKGKRFKTMEVTYKRKR